MSKTSFRSRTIDSERPLPIYHIDELNDLVDYAAVSRSIIQMPTGMEKEEETEQHIQIAMEAQATYGRTGGLVIPIPEVIQVGQVKYPPNRKYIPPKTYFKQSINFQENNQEYDADSDDESWLKQYYEKNGLSIDKNEFELCISKLEWLRSIQPQELKFNSVENIVNLPIKLISATFEYWKNKRKSLQNNHSLCPAVRTEQIDGVNSHDPYVAFRKRFEKMQTRKNRKQEEQVFERLIRTHINIIKSEGLFNLITKREEYKLNYQKRLKSLFLARNILSLNKSKNFNDSISSYYQKELLNYKSPSVIGAGILDSICLNFSKSHWKLNDIKFSSFSYSNAINNFIGRVSKVGPKNIELPYNDYKRKQNKPALTVYRDPSGHLFRYRINRSGQKMIDLLSDLQSIPLNIVEVDEYSSSLISKTDGINGISKISIPELPQSNSSSVIDNSHKTEHTSELIFSKNNILNGNCCENVHFECLDDGGV